MAKEKIGHKPPMYKTVEEFDNRVTEYFEYLKEEGYPATITGITMFLGFADKCSLYDYEKKNSGFAHSVKRVRLAVENVYEMNLHGNNVAGSVFALKNMGWKDKTEIDMKSDVTVKEYDDFFTTPKS